MAREFAKKFYHSKEWQEVRELVIKRDGGLCQECLKRGDVVPGEEVHHIEWLKPSNINDPSITTNPNNLEYVCKDCHFNIHKAIHHKLNKQLPSVTNGTYFDDAGELQKTMAYIVYGPPGAGKNTYVCKHKKYGDLVIDLDAIKEAISFESKGYYPDNLLGIATDIKYNLLTKIADKEVQARNIWIIVTLPRRKERSELCARLGAKLIFIDEDIDTCIAHVINDASRRNKRKEIEIINDWFAQYEE